MSTLDDERIAVVAGHMASEITHDWETTLETFDHPHYELFGSGQVFDGREAVMNYFITSRLAFPDQANEPIQLRAMQDAVLAEFWLTGTHKGAIKTPMGELPPTGKPIRVRMAAVFEFSPGSTKIVCERVYFDSAEILRQLTNRR